MEEMKGSRNRSKYLELVIFKKGTLVGTKKKNCCWNNRISIVAGITAFLYLY